MGSVLTNFQLAKFCLPPIFATMTRLGAEVTVSTSKGVSVKFKLIRAAMRFNVREGFNEQTRPALIMI